MKKYFSFSLTFLFVFILGFSVLSFAKIAEAKTDCKPGQVYDTATGTACANIATCVGETVNHLTGKPCAGKNPSTTNSSSNTSFANFIVDSMDSMKYGNKNEIDVAVLQSILNGLGFLNVQPTGNFLAQTASGVGKLQKSSGLKSDRVVGSKTKDAIKAVIARNPTLAEKIAKLVSGIPVKDIAKKKTADDNKDKGGNPSVVTVCPANKLAVNAIGGVATVTARSYFKLFKVTKDSKLGLITEDIGNTDGGEIPERKVFGLEKDEKLLIVEITDKNFSENAVLGEFTFEGKSFTTNAGDWSSAVTSIDSPAGSTKQIVTSVLEDELKKVRWGTPYELYPNASDPRIRAIGYKASWISAFPNGVVGANSKVVFYITKGAGVAALKNCGDAIKAVCPYPEEGTGDFDCKWPAVIPADPSPHRCGPSYLTEIHTDCKIVPPDNNIEVNAEVVFAPGRAAVTPYPYGVELVIFPSDGSTPEVHLQHFVPTPYPTEFSESHIKFFYKSTPGQPKPAMNKFDGKVVPQGNGGFKRNGLFETDAMAKWAILQPTVKCTPPDPATLDINVTEDCRGNVSWWPTPSQEINAHVKFSEAVVVTGVPVLKVKKANGQDGVLLSYVSGSDTNTLHFKYIVPSVLPPGFNYTKEDFMGNYAFQLPLASGATISTKATGAPVKLEGEWTAPDGPLCPTANSISGKMCVYYQEYIAANYQVTFPESVNVTGEPKLAIGGKLASYTGYGNADQTVLNFLVPYASGPIADYVGSGSLLLNGGSIEDADGNSVDLALGTLTTAAADQCNTAPWNWTYPGLATVTGATATKVGTGPSGSEGVEDAPTVKLTIALKFNKPANVLGIPSLYLEKASGQLGAKAEYVSGDGTDTLIFEHESNKPQDGYTLSQYDKVLYPKFKLNIVNSGSMHTVAPDGLTWWPANTSWLTDN